MAGVGVEEVELALEPIAQTGLAGKLADLLQPLKLFLIEDHHG
jgi:hypothetical protein